MLVACVSSPPAWNHSDGLPLSNSTLVSHPHCTFFHNVDTRTCVRDNFRQQKAPAATVWRQPLKLSYVTTIGVSQVAALVARVVLHFTQSVNHMHQSPMYGTPWACWATKRCTWERATTACGSGGTASDYASVRPTSHRRYNRIKDTWTIS